MEALDTESLDTEAEEKMTWEYFDDHYYNWDNDTIYERIQYLDNLGDHIRVKYSGLEGSIIDVNGDRYMIFLEDGTKVESYLESDLEDAF